MISIVQTELKIEFALRVVMKRLMNVVVFISNIMEMIGEELTKEENKR